MRILRAFLVAFGVLLVVAPTALADICCGEHANVTAQPSAAVPGMVVTFGHLDCTGIYNPPPRTATLGTYLLTTSSIADITNNLDTSTWAPFDKVERQGATGGRASIALPDLPPGEYFLWWTCNEPAQAVSVHSSAGPVVSIVSSLPPTDTASLQSSNEVADRDAGSAVALVAVTLALFGLRRRLGRGVDKGS